MSRCGSATCCGWHAAIRKTATHVQGQQRDMQEAGRAPVVTLMVAWGTCACPLQVIHMIVRISTSRVQQPDRP